MFYPMGANQDAAVYTSDKDFQTSGTGSGTPYNPSIPTLCAFSRRSPVTCPWSERRAEKRGRGRDVLLLEPEDCLPTVESIEDAVESHELAGHGSMAGRPGHPGAGAFLRRYWCGQCVDLVARQTGCSFNAMTKRLRRLREGLRHVLEQEEISI